MRILFLALIICSLPAAALALPPLPSLAPPPAAGTLVSEGELRRVVQEYLVQKGEHLGAELLIKKIAVGGELRLPPGKVSYEIMAPERWEGWGNASLALIVRVDDQVRKNLTVLVEVEALAEMLVATRTLERGEVIGESDVAPARRDLARVQGRICRNKEQVVGLRVKNTIRANSPLRGDSLERIPIVKSGQLVTIVVENEVVRITASGKAKGSGALGDAITVQNLSSQKELAARVVDAATVKVDF